MQCGAGARVDDRSAHRLNAYAENRLSSKLCDAAEGLPALPSASARVTVPGPMVR